MVVQNDVNHLLDPFVEMIEKKRNAPPSLVEEFENLCDDVIQPTIQATMRVLEDRLANLRVAVESDINLVSQEDSAALTIRVAMSLNRGRITGRGTLILEAHRNDVGIRVQYEGTGNAQPNYFPVEPREITTHWVRRLFADFLSRYVAPQ